MTLVIIGQQTVLCSNLHICVNLEDSIKIRYIESRFLQSSIRTFVPHNQNVGIRFTYSFHMVTRSKLSLRTRTKLRTNQIIKIACVALVVVLSSHTKERSTTDFGGQLGLLFLSPSISFALPSLFLPLCYNYFPRREINY